MYKENMPDTVYMTVHRCNITLHLRTKFEFWGNFQNSRDSHAEL